MSCRASSGVAQSDDFQNPICKIVERGKIDVRKKTK
jgi:hypothetical protein